MSYLLWTLIAVGLWNAVSFLARMHYKEPSMQHTWSIVLGIWASILMILENW